MLRLAAPSASELLDKCIEEGEALLERASLIGDFSDYESWKGTRKLWAERTAETLGRIYDGSEEVNDFREAAPAPSGEQQWQVEYKRDSNCVRSAIDVLVLFRDALGEGPAAGSEGEAQPADHPVPEHPPAIAELEQEPADRAASEPDPDIEPEAEPEAQADAPPHTEPESEPEPEPEPEADFTFTSTLARAPGPHPERAAAPVGESVAAPANGSSPLPATTSAGPSSNGSGQVFLVHGRDEKLRQAVADLLESAGPHPVTILNERPGDHRMLVEHFDEHGAESRYAVVLLTADDVGAPRLDSESEPYFSPRARQGVIFEMGVLVAALTPRCICVLYEDGVELPCDVDGIAYVRLDLAGTWQSKLLLHMRGAGFDYDLNTLAPI